jgi:hypothetical protein
METILKNNPSRLFFDKSFNFTCFTIQIAEKGLKYCGNEIGEVLLSDYKVYNKILKTEVCLIITFLSGNLTTGIFEA